MVRLLDQKCKRISKTVRRARQGGGPWNGKGKRRVIAEIEGVVCKPKAKYGKCMRGLTEVVEMTVFTKLAIVFGFVATLTSCGDDKKTDADLLSQPVMRWDHRPESDAWTKDTLQAIADNDFILARITPKDIDNWCPAYEENGQIERSLFWTGLVSALAKHESTWNPRAVGGGGRWIGLVQISPATARLYGCEARSTSALKDGSANLQCAMKIWSKTVRRDGVVSEGFRGVAADWGPFHNKRKREDMRAWTRAQSYCQK